MTKNILRSIGMAGLALGCAGLLGCGEDKTGRKVPVRLDVAADQPSALTARPAPKGAALATLTDGTNTLVVTRARLLAKQVGLFGPAHPAEAVVGVQEAPDDAMLTGASVGGRTVLYQGMSGGGNGNGNMGRDGGTDDGDLADDGYHFKAGAAVLDLDMTGAPTNLAIAGIFEGTYDVLGIHFHKANKHEAAGFAPEVIADFTTGGNYNIVIDGTWNGAPFQYRGSQSFNGHYAIAPALVVAAVDADGGVVITTLTVEFDLSGWFFGQRGNNGGQLLDPNDMRNMKEIAHSVAASVRTRH